MAIIKTKYSGQPENDSERKAIKWLSENLPDNYILFHNLELKSPLSKEVSYEYDIIIIGDYAVYAVEVKGWGGNIEGNAREWKLSLGDVRPSPIQQTNQKARVLKSFLCECAWHHQVEEEIKGVWVQPLVLLTDNNATLNIDEDPQSHLAVHLKDAKEYILDPNKLHSKYSVKALSHIAEKLSQVIQELYHPLHSEHEIGQYVVIDSIGNTSLYKILVARHRDITRRRAMLKVYNFDVYGDKRDRDREKNRIKRDIVALSELEGHPNFAQAYDFFSWEDKLVSATEWVDGYSLQGLIDSGESFTFAKKINIMLQLCEGLKYAHDNGVIHRDIRPENIIISSNTGIVKLINFDCARIADTRTISPQLKKLLREHSLELDIRYFAPELQRKIYEEVSIDMAKASTFSDIYALGIVFFELLTGQLPDKKFDETRLRENLSQEPIQLNSNASDNEFKIIRRIVRIVKRMVAYKPEERYKSLSKLIKDLKQIQTQLVPGG